MATTAETIEDLKALIASQSAASAATEAAAAERVLALEQTIERMAAAVPKAASFEHGRQIGVEMKVDSHDAIRVDH